GPRPLARPARVLRHAARRAGPHPPPLPVLPRRGPLDPGPRQRAGLVRDLPRLPRRPCARHGLGAPRDPGLRGTTMVSLIPGTFDARDLGGLPLVGGGTVRGGVLLRSDALAAAEDGAALLADVGTVIDLRTAQERD